MGNFYTPGKNAYYWAYAAYLADKNVYIKDARLLPFMPNAQHLYVAFYPQLWVDLVPATVYFFINDVPAGQAQVTTPDGFVSLQVALPKGKFTFKTTDVFGNLLNTEFFNTKNYAVFFDVAGQTLEQRAVDFMQIQNDMEWQAIRTSRLYPVVGVFFEFPPPPGWTNDQYRAAILGDCGPGFIKAFWWGGTKKGLKDVIKSITCADPVIQPVKNGNRWVLYDEASAPDVTDPGSNAWVLRDDAATPPHQNIELFDADYLTSAVDVLVPNSLRAVVDELVTKQTDSFIQSSIPEPWVLDGQSLVVTLEYTDDPASKATYVTVFPLGTTTAVLAAAAIIAQNPALSACYDAGGGILRIGVPPVATRVQRLTMANGAALATLGFQPGDSVDISSDQLNNPWVQTPVALSFGPNTYVQGVDYTVDNNSGQIIWAPNGPGNVLPPKGQAFLASYSYQMRREIEKIAALVSDATKQLNFIYL